MGNNAQPNNKLADSGLDADQLEQLKKQDVATWNKWREANPAIRIRLRRAKLDGLNLRGVDLSKADLFDTDLTGTDLIGANLNGADLRESILKKTRLSNATFIGAQLPGVDFQEVADLIRADFSGAELGGANLSGVLLDSANLSEAKLSGAYLRTTSLKNTNLRDADLNSSDVSGADFSQANLTGANVTGITFNRKTIHGKCLGVRGIESTYGNAVFKRVVADQDFIDARGREWNTSGWRWWFKVWGWIDYGRCLWCVALLGFLLILLFGTIYLLFPEIVGMSCPPAVQPRQTVPPTCAESAWFKPYSFPGFKPEVFSVTCTPLPATPQSESVAPCSARSDWLTPYYFSTVTFTTLGFGDYYAKTASGEALVILEVICGYITLGLMLSVLSDKIARRS